MLRKPARIKRLLFERDGDHVVWETYTLFYDYIKRKFGITYADAINPFSLDRRQL